MSARRPLPTDENRPPTSSMSSIGTPSKGLSRRQSIGRSCNKSKNNNNHLLEIENATLIVETVEGIPGSQNKRRKREREVEVIVQAPTSDFAGSMIDDDEQRTDDEDEGDDDNIAEMEIDPTCPSSSLLFPPRSTLPRLSAPLHSPQVIASRRSLASLSPAPPSRSRTATPLKQHFQQTSHSPAPPRSISKRTSRSPAPPTKTPTKSSSQLTSQKGRRKSRSSSAHKLLPTPNETMYAAPRSPESEGEDPLLLRGGEETRGAGEGKPRRSVSIANSRNSMGREREMTSEGTNTPRRKKKRISAPVLTRSAEGKEERIEWTEDELAPSGSGGALSDFEKDTNEDSSRGDSGNNYKAGVAQILPTPEEIQDQNYDWNDWGAADVEDRLPFDAPSDSETDSPIASTSHSIRRDYIVPVSFSSPEASSTAMTKRRPSSPAPPPWMDSSVLDEYDTVGRLSSVETLRADEFANAVDRTHENEAETVLEFTEPADEEMKLQDDLELAAEEEEAEEELVEDEQVSRATFNDEEREDSRTPISGHEEEEDAQAQVFYGGSDNEAEVREQSLSIRNTPSNSNPSRQSYYDSPILPTPQIARRQPSRLSSTTNRRTPNRRSHPTLPVVNISSSNPQAAARAAAILKVYHEYVQDGSALPENLVDARTRKSSILMDGEEDEGTEFERKALLVLAEEEVMSRQISAAPSASASVSRARQSRSFSNAASTSTLMCRASVSVPPEQRRQSWIPADWRSLEKALIKDKRAAKNEGRATSIDNTIHLFLKGEGLVREECTGDWDWIKLTTRTTALLQRRTRDSSVRAESNMSRAISSASSQGSVIALGEELSKAVERTERSRDREPLRERSVATEIQLDVLRDDDVDTHFGPPARRSRSQSKLRYSIKLEDEDEEEMIFVEPESQDEEDNRRSAPPSAFIAHRLAHLYDDPIEKPDLPEEYRSQEALENRRRANEMAGESTARKEWSYIGGILNGKNVLTSLKENIDVTAEEGDCSFASSTSSTTTEDTIHNSLRPSLPFNSSESTPSRTTTTQFFSPLGQPFHPRHPLYNHSNFSAPSVTELIKRREGLLPPPSPDFLLRDVGNRRT